MNSGRVVIRGSEFTVGVADTFMEKHRGLSGRDSLERDEGMLFVFSRPAVRRFWMKDILIPIDVIWIHDGDVVGFHENAGPEPGVPMHKLKRYLSPIPVEYVLEVGAGVVKSFGIVVGDSVSIRL